MPKKVIFWGPLCHAANVVKLVILHVLKHITLTDQMKTRSSSMQCIIEVIQKFKCPFSTASPSICRCQGPFLQPYANSCRKMYESKGIKSGIPDLNFEKIHNDYHHTKSSENLGFMASFDKCLAFSQFQPCSLLFISLICIFIQFGYLKSRFFKKCIQGVLETFVITSNISKDEVTKVSRTPQMHFFIQPRYFEPYPPTF